MKKSDYYFWAGFALSFFTPIVAGYLEELYVSMHGYLIGMVFLSSLATYVY